MDLITILAYFIVYTNTYMYMYQAAILCGN